jgi:hypothetical protein
MKTDITELGCKNVNWIQLAQDRAKLRALVSTASALRAHASGEFVSHQLKEESAPWS